MEEADHVDPDHDHNMTAEDVSKLTQHHPLEIVKATRVCRGAANQKIPKSGRSFPRGWISDYCLSVTTIRDKAIDVVGNADVLTTCRSYSGRRPRVLGVTVLRCCLVPRLAFPRAACRPCRLWVLADSLPALPWVTVVHCRPALGLAVHHAASGITLYLEATYRCQRQHLGVMVTLAHA